MTATVQNQIALTLLSRHDHNCGHVKQASRWLRRVQALIESGRLSRTQAADDLQRYMQNTRAQAMELRAMRERMVDGVTARRLGSLPWWARALQRLSDKRYGQFRLEKPVDAYFRRSAQMGGPDRVAQLGRAGLATAHANSRGSLLARLVDKNESALTLTPGDFGEIVGRVKSKNPIIPSPWTESYRNSTIADLLDGYSVRSSDVLLQLLDPTRFQTYSPRVQAAFRDPLRRYENVRSQLLDLESRPAVLQRLISGEELATPGRRLVKARELTRDPMAWVWKGGDFDDFSTKPDIFVSGNPTVAAGYAARPGSRLYRAQNPGGLVFTEHLATVDNAARIRSRLGGGSMRRYNSRRLKTESAQKDYEALLPSGRKFEPTDIYELVAKAPDAGDSLFRRLIPRPPTPTQRKHYETELNHLKQTLPRRRVELRQEQRSLGSDLDSLIRSYNPWSQKEDAVKPYVTTIPSS